MKLRKPHEIVEQVLAVETLPLPMRKTFKQVKWRILHLPPEHEREALVRINTAFNRFVPKPPTENWHYDAAAAFMNTTIDILQEQFPAT